MAGTLSRMPKNRYVERQLLQGLEKHAALNNYLGALNFVSVCECFNLFAVANFRLLQPSLPPNPLPPLFNNPADPLPNNDQTCNDKIGRGSVGLFFACLAGG